MEVATPVVVLLMPLVGAATRVVVAMHPVVEAATRVVAVVGRMAVAVVVLRVVAVVERPVVERISRTGFGGTRRAHPICHPSGKSPVDDPGQPRTEEAPRLWVT